MGYKHHVPILNSVVVAVSVDLCTGRHFAKQNCLSFYQGNYWWSSQAVFWAHCMRAYGSSCFCTYTCVTRMHTVHDFRIWSWFKKHFRISGFHIL